MSRNPTLRPKVSQDELRKMMSREKHKHTKIAREIDSPLARYMKDGSVICILCNTTINKQLTWTNHISSKGHRDKVYLAKDKKLLTIELRPGKEIGDLKRSAEETFKEPVPLKKPKGILKNAPALPPSKVTFESSEIKSSGDKAKSTLVQYDSGDDSEEDTQKPSATSTAVVSSGSHRGDTVPEGFFDDPVMDAKARNMEYRDPQEEEWDRFQKEMKEEATMSAQIIAEDQEEATVERTIEEMDEQLRRWGRVMELVKKKEEVRTTERKAMDVDDEDLPDDAEDFDEFLDWRSKKSYR